MMDKIEEEMKEAQVSAFKDMKTFYLFVYNMFMWIGFSYVFVVLNFRYYKDGEGISTFLSLLLLECKNC